MSSKHENLQLLTIDFEQVVASIDMGEPSIGPKI